MAKKRVVLLLLGIMLGMSALPGQVAFAAEFSDAGTEIVSEVEESSAEDKGLGDGETSLDQEIETETTETQEEFSSEAGENTGQEPEEVDSSLDEPEDGSVVDVEPAEEESQFDDGVLSVEEEDETIATDELEGSQYLNTWHWDPITGAFSYYDGEGKAVSVAQLNAQSQADGTYTGYFNINGDFYCLDDNGVPRTGDVALTVNGTTASYYFQETAGADGIPGKMYAGGWLQRSTAKGERWLYYDTGSSNSANRGKLYVHGVITTKLDASIKGGDTYLIDKNGYVLKKTMKKAQNGKYYLTDSRGRIYRSKLVAYKNNYYYVGKNGARVTWQNQWHRCTGAGNRIYYFGKTPGKVVKKTGWQKVTVNGKFYGWFNFGNSGNHFKSKLLKAGYYFLENGKLASGKTKIGKKYYFFTPSTSAQRNGKMVKGQLASDGKNTYYAYKTGVLRKDGWQTIGGKSYYFKNYKMVKNTFIKKGKTYGYLDGTGRFTTGWVIEDDANNKVRYVNPSAKGFLKNTSKVIDGLLYYFDSDGYRINDVSDRVSGPYYLVCDRVNGVMTVYNSNRTIPVKTIRVSVGLASTATPLGTYTLNRSARWQALMGNSWGQYGTHVTGGIFIHSVPSGSPDIYDLPSSYYYALGEPASHGCIRVCVADSKWVYENCNGATISIVDNAAVSEESFKGPLGRNPLVPLRAPYTFDPTDPEVD